MKTVHPGAPRWGVRGIALPLILVLLLALTLLGHGILLLARQEFQASRAYLHAVRGDLASSGALDLGLKSLPGFSQPRLPGAVIPIASEWIEGDLWRGVGLRWLGSELFLLEGEGRSRGWPGTRRRGAVGWMLDPVTRIGALKGGVELGGTLIQGPGTEASASSLLAPPTGWGPEECEGFGPTLDSLFSLRTLPLTAGLHLPEPGSSEEGTEIPPLGLLSGPELLARAEEAGALSPGTSSFSAGAGCPDSEAPRLAGSSGDLSIRDTGVCGVLVVAGDLLLGGTGTFQGLALVAGDLRLEGGVLFEGMARVGGSVTLEDLAILRISACPAIRALSEAAPLLKPLVLSGASRISLF